MGNASSYATGPFLASISKGPQNLGANLPHLPKINKLQVNMITYLKVLIFSFPIRINFLEVLCFLKIHLDLGNQLFQVHQQIRP